MSILNTANYSLGGTLPANAVTINLFKETLVGDTVGWDESTDLLTGLAGQQVQAQVQKSVKPVYEIGSTKYYVIDGRPQGQGQIAYLFGPSGVVVSALTSFANLCNTCTLQVSNTGAKNCPEGSPGYAPIAKAGETGKAQGETMLFSGGTLSSFSITATADNFMVTGNIGFIFMDVRTPGEKPTLPTKS